LRPAPRRSAQRESTSRQDVTPQFAIMVAWGLWVVSWIVAALWSDSAAKRPAFGEEWLYRVMTAAGAFLLFTRFGRLDALRARFWDLGEGIDWVLFAVAALGLAFAWWARLHLGRLWSSSVTKKADHRVIDTGPYAIVRHPIYTGILAAVYATTIVKASPAAIAGALLMTCGFWIKARLEERFLREQLGADAYDSYRRKAPMLLPFGPKSE
jgi:protein-S-isoprenylcysteine O-methyltransferase Ste14